MPSQPTNDLPQNQLAYASHYDSGAARAAVVNINIGEFAHFDRTTVASSAEEKDMLAALQTNVTQSMYRLFAEAANRAQSALNFNFG